jgi:hypothetical protein
MIDLPQPDTLARLVSNVTETMFGMKFSLADAVDQHPWSPPSPWHTVVLPILGGRPLLVAMASDVIGGRALGSAMFACPVEKVDKQMIDDSLSELVNIVAGQIKSVLGLDQALGLPKVIGAQPPSNDLASWRGARMQNDTTDVRVWVAITESP